MKVAGHQYVLHKSTAGADRNYIVNVQSGTGFFVGGFSPGGTWSPVVSTTNVADGKWHYLTQTYDKKAIRFSRGTPTFPSMANGQIKGVGNARKFHEINSGGLGN